MHDIQRADLRLFLEESVRPMRVLLSAMAILWVFGLRSAIPPHSWLWVLMNVALITLTLHALFAFSASTKRRFTNPKFAFLWKSCQERLKLFNEVRQKLAKDRIGEWEDLPKTIDRVADSLYLALRRADAISHEVALTEKGLYSQPPNWATPSHDPQAKELYRIADKNIAEYRSQFSAVMAGVHRTEAQCAVFMTTVDTLRMKMIGYRLVGRQPEVSSIEFLEAMTEAKQQLAAIDTALDELLLMPSPTMIATIPDVRSSDDEHQSERL